MAPAPSSARRLVPRGCALAATLALVLSGCGEEGAAPPGNATAQPQAGSEDRPQPEAKQRSTRPGAATGCFRQVDAFVESLDGLRDRLAVGFGYEQYAAAIEDLRASYDRIPVDRLALDCLAATGIPGEQALNEYIDGANAWGECLADPSCTTATIEPVLQRKWRVASRFLSEAR